ncbi:MAG: VWA domain-containing protein [Cytophagales bacterium]|nr:VWA domain-containing protein [Cytophagales bacterium]
MQWINSLSWAEYLFIAFFVLAYLLFGWRLWKASRRFSLRLSTILFKLLLRAAYFALFLVSLMGPSFGNTSKEIKAIGKDIFLCVDLSGSMDATDIQPSRLEKVKFELKKIIAAFGGDRLGLIIFSSNAFMQCPLTFDQGALNLFVEALHSGLVPSSGTDFGPALKLALEKLQDEQESSLQRKSSKVIVLISDGEDFGGEAEALADQLEDKGVKLFTLGVGTEAGGKIPNASGYKTDRNGQVVVSKLNNEALKRLATLTRGNYYEINQSRNEVSKMINTIDGLEGELREARQIDTGANKYHYFLALALLLMLIDLLFRPKAITI